MPVRERAVTPALMLGVVLNSPHGGFPLRNVPGLSALIRLSGSSTGRLAWRKNPPQPPGTPSSPDPFMRFSDYLWFTGRYERAMAAHTSSGIRKRVADHNSVEAGPHRLGVRTLDCRKAGLRGTFRP